MNECVIRVADLSKSYRIASGPVSPYLADQITRFATAPLRAMGALKRHTVKAGPKRFWAIKDVSFEVREGDVLGIIGRNGAGKSTLLKILSRITAPETGEVDLYGRVGSLLEVGTGFHAELTGRENVFLNGSILGMTRREIAKRFDEIVSFAEVETFIDMPVKFYSTGMYMRLAFAVAAHLDTELLLVDEVLAVGDTNFQRKCLGKMGDLAAHGRTVLLVSHQLNQIRRLCSSCLWLDNGSVREHGPAELVVSHYEGAALSESISERQNDDGNKFQFLSWYLADTQDDNRHSLDHFSSLQVVVHVSVPQSIDDALLGICLRNADGLIVWSAAARAVSLKCPTSNIEFQLPQLPIRPGPYWWSMTVHRDGQLLDSWEALPPLNVITEPRAHYSDVWKGLLNYPLEPVVTS